MKLLKKFQGESLTRHYTCYKDLIKSGILGLIISNYFLKILYIMDEQ